MIINHNLGAMNAHRQLGANQNDMGNSMEKLSSGLRINRAGDDAAGLAISEKMRGQIRGLEQANRNAQDGISMIQTAEGGLNESHSILQRMRELAVQSSNDTNTDTDRGEIQKEVDQLVEELDRISSNTEFNTKKLLNGDMGNSLEGSFTEVTSDPTVNITGGDIADGDTVSVTETINHGTESTGGAADGAFEDATYNLSFNGENADVSFTKAELDEGTTSKSVEVGGATFEVKAGDDLTSSTGSGAGTETAADDLTADVKSASFQIGANSDQDVRLSFSDMSADALGVKGINLSDSESADDAITTINSAIESVSAERSKLGAYQNRLDHTINNLGTSAENLQAAESRIRDVDMASEMMQMTKNNILSQASQSMLAQANQQPQSVLQLLQ